MNPVDLIVVSILDPIAALMTGSIKDPYQIYIQEILLSLPFRIFSMFRE